LFDLLAIVQAAPVVAAPTTGMTPEMPFTLAVAVFGAVLSWVLPVRYAVIPLAIVMCAYPSELLIPPPQVQLTAARFIGFALLMRCVCTGEIRHQFKWQWVDSGALFYYALLMIAQCYTGASVGVAINNRIGFFLSALVPFWCVRFLVTDRQRLYLVLKTFLWTAAPLALLGVVQMQSGSTPFEAVMKYSPHWVLISRQLVMQRSFMGTMYFRSTGPFQQSIMYGWFFSIWVTPATNLYFEKRSFFPWIIPWLMLPVGAISTISAGPMGMAVMTLGIVAMFGLRRRWRLGVGAFVLAFVLLPLASNRGPMQIAADAGFDQSSSWYRVRLEDYTTSIGMRGHWWTGYGEIPPWWPDNCHDLCIHWVYLLVLSGLLGVIGFYTLILSVGWMLWIGKRRASEATEDHWLLWTMMAGLGGSLLGMLVVSLFAEMYHIYHFFLGLVANAFLIVGQKSAGGGGDRYVGVMAESQGKPVLLRYRLRPGQKLALVHPPAPPENTATPPSGR
jgi:hypothetical protein